MLAKVFLGRSGIRLVRIFRGVKPTQIHRLAVTFYLRAPLLPPTVAIDTLETRSIVPWGCCVARVLLVGGRSEISRNVVFTVAVDVIYVRGRFVAVMQQEHYAMYAVKPTTNVDV